MVVNLVAELSKPDYLADLESGNNTSLVQRLNVQRFQVVAVRSASEMVNAVAPYIRHLSVAEQEALKTILSGGLDYSDSTKVLALKDLWSGKPMESAASMAIDSLSQVDAKFTLEQVESVLRQLPNSHVSRQESTDHSAKVRRINRVGYKIRAVRDRGELRGTDFVEWRYQIYEQGSDDNREAFVDAKASELGLDVDELNREADG